MDTTKTAQHIAQLGSHLERLGRGMRELAPAFQEAAAVAAVLSQAANTTQATRPEPVKATIQRDDV